MTQSLFDLLRAHADARESRIAASGADPIHGSTKIAVMTTYALLREVQGERYAAILTTQHIPAKSTLEKIREASAVEKNQTLPRFSIIVT